MEDRRPYAWLKTLTIVGPTLFVAIGELVREVYLRKHLSHYVVSAIAIATTLVAAVLFSWYMFRTLEALEKERRTYKEALLSLKERERLAREMHDGLSQNLAVLKLEAYKLKSLIQGQPELSAELESMDKLINQTYLEVRQTLYDLRASQRLDEGFWPTIDRQLGQFQSQTNIEVVVDCPQPREEPWGELASVQILRIIQEALTNVRKHAMARTVHLECENQGNATQFTLRDDGCGFETAPSGVSADHYGLLVMRERAESIGGALMVHSQPGQGTAISWVVPDEGRQRASGKGKINTSR